MPLLPNPKWHGQFQGNARDIWEDLNATERQDVLDDFENEIAARRDNY